jgi:alkanesulfonate monooxygenase SsuD/methylene tetrahydromethanopterin reductase-like flavin-dependent oxidoreductase (luciferase family)
MPIGFHVDAWLAADGRIPENVRRAMAHMVGTYALWRDQNGGSASTTLPPVDQTQISGRSLLGTPADIIRNLRPWIDEFGDRELHVIVRLHYPGMRADDAAPAVRLFATEVMPALRSVTISR